MAAANFVATLTIVGAQTAVARTSEVVSAAMVPAATMSGGLLAQEQLGSPLNPAGNLTANVIPEQFISAVLTSSGVLASSPVVVNSAVASLAAAGAISSTFSTADSISGSLDVTGIMSGEVLPQQFPTAIFAASVFMNSSLLEIEQLTSSLDITTGMSSSFFEVKQFSASLALLGTLTTNIIPQQFLDTSLELAISLASLSAGVFNQTAELSGQVSFVADVSSAASGVDVSAVMMVTGALGLPLNVILGTEVHFDMGTSLVADLIPQQYLETALAVSAFVSTEINISTTLLTELTGEIATFAGITNDSILEIRFDISGELTAILGQISGHREVNPNLELKGFRSTMYLNGVSSRTALVGASGGTLNTPVGDVMQLIGRDDRKLP